MRDQILSWLRVVGEVTDPDGLASNALAKAVGYPRSSVAFAQLLSGMERAGLIEREIRGKRTYRIRLAKPGTAPACDAVPVRAASGARPSARATSVRDRNPGTHSDAVRREADSAVGADAGFDYEELARRLLVQVAERLAHPPRGPAPSAVRVPAPDETAAAPGQADLARTAASLKRKLASIQARQRKLSEENAMLREQLAAAQQSLADMRHTGSRDAEWSGRLDAAEVQMLHRLMSSLHADAAGRKNAEAG